MQNITGKTLEDTMYYNRTPVLIYKINYPFFTTTCSKSSAQTINEHYFQSSMNTEMYCRTVLYPMAAESARYLQPGQPFNTYSLYVTYKVTYNTGCITSLYTDTYSYLGGAHGETKRTSDTWDFDTGYPLKLEHFFTPLIHSYVNFQEHIEQQTAERLKIEPGSYFENYQSLIRSYFNPQSFYLAPGSIVIYYQQYDVAPYVTGIPEFTFPFSA